MESESSTHVKLDGPVRPPNRVIRFRELSSPRQALVRLCQTINRGSLEGLEVRQAEPVLDPLPVIVRDVKLDKAEEPRRELGLNDFMLSNEIIRLLGLLEETQCGAIRLIEIREGIPRRVLLVSRANGAPQPQDSERAK